jgi:hypothetical protein
MRLSGRSLARAISRLDRRRSGLGKKKELSNEEKGKEGSHQRAKKGRQVTAY